MESLEETVEHEAAEGSYIALLFLGIACMFFAQHHICDSYFVPAINVFVERMSQSERPGIRRWGEEAVAGATICALGCNGPELFTNLISLYVGADEGSGVIVGSEVFNLLVIIGCTILTAPEVPLQLDPLPFARDCFFYGLSIVLLYNFLLSHHVVTWHEAVTLVFFAAIYITTVYFTPDIAAYLPCCTNPNLKSDGDVAPSDQPKGRMHGIDVDIVEIHHGRWATNRAHQWLMDDTLVDHEPAREEGEPKYSLAAKSARLRHTGTTEFQFIGDVGPAMQPILRYADLQEVTLLTDQTIEMEFRHGLSRTTLQVTTVNAADRAKLLDAIREHSLERPWVHEYDATVFGAWHHLTHACSSRSVGILGKMFAIVEFIADVPLKLTLFSVDVRDLRKHGCWPLCFLGAMVWLGLASYGMLTLAVRIEHALHLNPAFVGLTLCAVGTSFPNAVASILLSQAGKPGAAVASALGSNVQNVFLAMGLPWLIYSCQTGGASIPQKLDGIQEGVLWMILTLGLVVFIAVTGKCSLCKGSGYLFIFIYLVFLVMMSGENLGWWPPLIMVED